MFGTVLTGLEAIAFAATVEATIEKQILQTKISDLMKEQ